jgi:hypothetical protein
VRLLLLLLLLLCAALAAAPCAARAGDAPRADEGEDVVEPLPWHRTKDTIFQRRIVDAATRAPIEGAVVKMFCEVPHPRPGLGTPAAVGTSRADGWVVVREDALDAAVTAAYGQPTWAYVDAAGRAPDACMNSFLLDGEAEWPLHPATTLRVGLRDPLGRPVAGARVGWLLGCGHTPDVREARTGADGIAVLEGAGDTTRTGSIWVVAEGLRAAHNYLRESWLPWQSPRFETLTWASAIEGTVIDAGGEPVEGAAVGRWQCHRGPWTVTDAAGRFRLLGSDAHSGADVAVELGEYPVGPSAPARRPLATTFPAPVPGRRATVRLTGACDEDEVEKVRLVAEVEVTGGSSDDVPVVGYAVRASDGWTVMAGIHEAGLVLDVPPGTYAIEAFAEASPGSIVASRASAAVSVEAGRPARVRLAIPAPAVQPFDLDPRHEDDEVSVVTDGATTRLDGTRGRRTEVVLPTDRDVFVRVVRAGRERLVPLDRSTLRAGVRAPVVRIEPQPPVVLRASLVASDGTPVPGRIVEIVEDEDFDMHEAPTSGEASATPSVTVEAGVDLTLVAWPEDLERFQPSFVRVPAATPTKDDSPVNLGEVHVAARAPALRLERADGKPHGGAGVLVTRGERASLLWVEESGRLRDVWDEAGLVADGALVRVVDGSESDAGADVPFVRRLEGAGPWTVRAPAGSLTIEARDPEDAALKSFTVHLDGAWYAANGSSLRLSTLEAGLHEVVVEAPGMTPRRLRFTLAEGEQRTWTARLRPAR